MGMIDGTEILTRRDLHEALKQALELPEYYGMNLDALADCVGDIFEPRVLAVKNEERLLENLGTYWETALYILTNEGNPNLTVILE